MTVDEELSDPPDAPPPTADDEGLLSPSRSAVRSFSRRWAPWAAAAACLALLWMWSRPGPPIVLLQGSQFVQGHAVVLAGPTEVEVAGRALIEVEPPDTFPGVGELEAGDMTKAQVLAAMAGAIVTVTVYEGSAELRAEHAGSVTVLPGETRTGGPAPPSSEQE
jgi:ferric-dicitrate binding protein FerR (iron transport regulator)